MKKIVYFLIACFFISNTFTAFSQEAEENEIAYSTNKVKSIKAYDYRYRKGKARGKGKLASHTIYDSSGRQIESWSYLKIYSFIRSEYHQLYKYNQNGDVCEETSYVVKGLSPLITNFSYVYDDQERMLEK